MNPAPQPPHLPSVSTIDPEIMSARGLTAISAEYLAYLQDIQPHLPAIKALIENLLANYLPAGVDVWLIANAKQQHQLAMGEGDEGLRRDQRLIGEINRLRSLVVEAHLIDGWAFVKDSNDIEQLDDNTHGNRIGAVWCAGCPWYRVNKTDLIANGRVAHAAHVASLLDGPAK